MWIIIREANNSKRVCSQQGPHVPGTAFGTYVPGTAFGTYVLFLFQFPPHFLYVFACSRRSSIVRCDRVAKVVCFVLVARDELRRVHGACVNGGCTVILRVGPPRCFMYNEQDRVCWGSHSHRVGKRLEALLLPTHVSYHFASHRLPANKFSQ